MTLSSPSAKVIADSITPLGDRLTTMEVRCHRFILAEFNTHRAFSRNSASSRAIPLKKQLGRVADDPAIPEVFPLEQPGMSGGESLSGQALADVLQIWHEAAEDASIHAERLGRMGVHKSVVNRLLEPFMWHTIIVSATSWKNFFVQRCSPLAQPEMQVLANAMEFALAMSEAVPLEYNEWHLPFVSAVDLGECYDVGIDPRFVSSARCARVSYLTHDGIRDIAKDVELYERLVSAEPPHASPLEHVATPASLDFGLGNFKGWHQFRHEILGVVVG